MEFCPIFHSFIHNIQYHYFEKIIQWLLVSWRSAWWKPKLNWKAWKFEVAQLLSNFCIIRYQQSAPNPVEHLEFCENWAGMAALKWNEIWTRTVRLNDIYNVKNALVRSCITSRCASLEFSSVWGRKRQQSARKVASLESWILNKVMDKVRL